ncbi:MAG: undecaprenyl-diphosphate phosphatase [Ruminococcaceae bacterium]|nr:undecaprenyl-diphosphate phosphatase [Oscillospiraceae bacterium]
MKFIEILKAIFLGIVEGITEWLPVSSTGHMILTDEFIRLNVSAEFKEMFFVVIQLGAILAVPTLFFEKLNPFSRKKTKEEKKGTIDLWCKVIVGALPAAVAGLILDDFLDEHLYNSTVISIALIVYGIAFILIERMKRVKANEFRINDVSELTYKDALAIGAFQILSLIPGTSRSGSTIIGGMLGGVSRVASAEFSFFMAIPIMLGASGLKILKFILGGATVSTFEIALLLIGIAVSYIVSVIVIKFLMDFVKRHSFSAFGIYRIILGIIVLGYFIFV